MGCGCSAPKRTNKQLSASNLLVNVGEIHSAFVFGSANQPEPSENGEDKRASMSAGRVDLKNMRDKSISVSIEGGIKFRATSRKKSRMDSRVNLVSRAEMTPIEVWRLSVYLFITSYFMLTQFLNLFFNHVTLF